jgi:uncharacterized Zn-finger protein
VIPPPEVIRVSSHRVVCDGTAQNGDGAGPEHPRVFLAIDESGYIDCGYCDRRFVLIGGAADGADQFTLADHPSGAGS